jgi:diguanylate cyclase (GGDEF)-like protein
VLDLDGLKELNDSHGHATGDECLVRTGRLLQTELRPRDRAYRIGGDEFAVLLPATDRRGAEDVQGRLTDWLERNSRSSALRVQASLGIATTGAGLETADALLGSADQAMYRAKHARKLSRVVSD